MTNVVPLHSHVYGATPADWAHMRLVVGDADLLPVVSNPNAVISPQSTIKGLGKTPSLYNGNRQAVGIQKWTQKQTTAEDIARWSKDSDLGICVQTRFWRALDIDVPDPERAWEIANLFRRAVGALPIRSRENSGKMLLVFAYTGELRKSSFKLANGEGMVELLADGQQFIAVGTHTSGVRYEWLDGLPVEAPELDNLTLEIGWSTLVDEFAAEPAIEGSESADRSRADLEGIDDPVATYLEEQGLVLGHQGEKLFVECPWKAGHSSDSGISEAAWLVAGTKGFERGHFQCLHASCQGRTDGDFEDAIAFRVAAFRNLDLEADEEGGPAVDTQRFRPRSVNEVLALKRPGWFVKGLLPRAGLAVVYGESGSGKTFWVLDLVMHVALGRSWRGKPVKAGRVIYVPAEGQGGFRNRLEAFLLQNELSDIDRFSVVTDIPDLRSMDDKKMADQALAWGGADIIVIDTLAQATPGANENSSEDLGKAMQACRRLHEATGALILLVHHAGKDPTKGARGWSGLKAGADVEIEIVRSGDVRHARVSKQKDGEDGVRFGFELVRVVLDVDEDGDPITSMVVAQSDNCPSQRRKMPPWQELVYQTIMGLLGTSVGTVTATTVLKHAAERGYHDPGSDPAKPKKDRRRDNCVRGLNGLIRNGDVVKIGEELSIPQNHAAPQLGLCGFEAQPLEPPQSHTTL